jgi:hypothetical protein
MRMGRFSRLAPAAAAAGDHTHALFADQSQSILDDLAVLLGVELHAFSRRDRPDPKARADIEDNFRKTIGQALGGLFVLLGAGLAYYGTLETLMMRGAFSRPR